MEAFAADIAVFGSGPAAALLAGCLASNHAMQVALIGESYSPLRLPRGLTLAAGTITRPESWALLRALEGELAELLSKAGMADALSGTDVMVHADLPATRAALDHIRHLAPGYGLKVASSRDGSELTFRNVARLHEERLHPRLGTWLDSLGVVRVPVGDAVLTLQKSGKATIEGKDRTISATQVVLADDAALISELGDEAWPELLAAIDASAILTSSSRGLRPQVQLYPDRGTLLSAHGEGLLVHIQGASERDARLGATLTGKLPLLRIATRRLRKVMTRDGAPYAGWLKAPKLFAVAGLGEAAAFFAPALARLIAGTPSPDEKAWFAARDPSHVTGRAAVAEFVAGEFQ